MTSALDSDIEGSTRHIAVAESLFVGGGAIAVADPAQSRVRLPEIVL